MYTALKPCVLDYFVGKLSSQGQHHDSGSTRSTHIPREKYKPDWYFSADQNLQYRRPMKKAHDLTQRKATGSSDDNMLLIKY